MHAIGLLLRVVAVFALLGGTLWVLRRGMPGQRRTSMVQVVESVRLGKSASASLLRVGDTTYLVGVTDHGVALLAEPKLAEAEDTVDEPAADQTPGAPAAAPAGPPTMRAFLTTVATRGMAQLRSVRSRLDADAAEVASRKPRATWRRPSLAAFTSAFGEQLRQLRPMRPQLAAAGMGGAAVGPAAPAAPSFEAVLAEQLADELQIDQPADDEPVRTAVLSVVADDEDIADEYDEGDGYDEEEVDDVVPVSEAESLALLARQLQMLDHLPKTTTTPVRPVAEGSAADIAPAPSTTTHAHRSRSTRTDAPRIFDEEHPWSLPCRRARQHTGPRATSLV